MPLDLKVFLYFGAIELFLRKRNERGRAATALKLAQQIVVVLCGDEVRACAILVDLNDAERILRIALQPEAGVDLVNKSDHSVRAFAERFDELLVELGRLQGDVVKLLGSVVRAQLGCCCGALHFFHQIQNSLCPVLWGGVSVLSNLGEPSVKIDTLLLFSALPSELDSTAFCAVLRGEKLVAFNRIECLIDSDEGGVSRFWRLKRGIPPRGDIFTQSFISSRRVLGLADFQSELPTPALFFSAGTLLSRCCSLFRRHCTLFLAYPTKNFLATHGVARPAIHISSGAATGNVDVVLRRLAAKGLPSNGVRRRSHALPLYGHLGSVLLCLLRR